jgi:hypothetical protein
MPAVVDVSLACARVISRIILKRKRQAQLKQIGPASGMNR